MTALRAALLTWLVGTGGIALIVMVPHGWVLVLLALLLFACLGEHETHKTRRP